MEIEGGGRLKGEDDQDPSLLLQRETKKMYIDLIFVSWRLANVMHQLPLFHSSCAVYAAVASFSR